MEYKLHVCAYIIIMEKECVLVGDVLVCMYACTYMLVH